MATCKIPPPPYVPQDGHTVLIGQIGSAPEWHYFDDDPKGRDAALAWLGLSPTGLRRLFRVYLDGVAELEVTPPVLSKLREKEVPE